MELMGIQETVSLLIFSKESFTSLGENWKPHGHAIKEYFLFQVQETWFEELTELYFACL